MSFKEYILESVESNDSNHSNVYFDFDSIKVNEDGELELNIHEHELERFIKSGILNLKHNNKTFSSIKEACSNYTINEEEKKSKEEINKIKIKDPETGEEKFFEVGLGNSKVGFDTIVINMTSAHNCMSAVIGTCKLGASGECYALRFEKRYKDTSLEKNLKHEKQWACSTPAAIANSLDIVIKKIGSRIKYVRVNEAGEFRNLPSDPDMLALVSDEKKAELAEIDDVEKLKQVAAEMKKLNSDIMFYTYTHRSDLKIGNLGENVCVNGSGFMIDNAFMPLDVDEYLEVWESYKEEGLKNINGVEVKTIVRCLGDCKICKFCKVKKGMHIIIPVHGGGTKYDVLKRKMLMSVVSNEEFQEIYNSDASLEEKAKKLYNNLTPEYKKLLDYLIPVKTDIYEFFMDFIKSKGDEKVLYTAIKKYLNSTKNGKRTIKVDDKMKKDALVLSIDALSGKLKSDIKRAEEKESETGIKKWSSLLNTLNKAIDDAKKNKDVKISKKLVAQHKDVLRNIEKEKETIKESKFLEYTRNL
jgi:hypothetical protein